MRVSVQQLKRRTCIHRYTPPSCPATALLQSESCIEPQWRSPDDGAVGAGSQGPGDRKLSSNTLSYIVFQSRLGDIRPIQEYRLFFHLAHCCMDGVAALLLVNAFFALLGGSCTPGQPPRSDHELEGLLKSEWEKRWSSASVIRENVIPVCAEARLPELAGQWRRVASKIEHSARQKRVIVSLPQTQSFRAHRTQSNHVAILLGWPYLSSQTFFNHKKHCPNDDL